MASVLVDIRTPPPDQALGLVCGYATVVVEVSDVERASGFYTGLLGFARAGDTPEGPRLRLGAHHVVLARSDRPRTLPETGAHAGYRFPAAELEAVRERLEAAGVPVHGYREDREAERTENRYCADSDGNRIQLVAGPARGIDHAAVETHDLEWSEVFYVQVLGGLVETRIGWRMEHYVRAWDWGEGRDECAPGTRRRDKRYTTIENEAVLPRPNAQIFVTLGADVTLGVYLATEHRQEPPRERFRGTPRLVFRVRPGGLAELERRLREVRLRCLPVSAEGGPFERDGTSLFVRDPGGNFIELTE